MKILGVSGIYTDGKGSTDLVLDQLMARGFDTLDVHQRRRWAITAWWNADNDAEQITDEATDGDVIVAHSYGCLKSLHAAKFVAFKAMFLFAPAVERSWDFDRLRTVAQNVYCIYTPEDGAIALGVKLPFHPFGNAGRKGFLHKNVHNVSVPEIGKDHSGFFRGAQLTRWVDFIEERVG